MTPQNRGLTIAAVLVTASGLIAGAAEASAEPDAATEFAAAVLPAAQAAFADATLVHTDHEVLPGQLPGTTVDLTAAMFKTGPRGSALVTRQVGGVTAVNTTGRDAQVSRTAGGEMTSLRWTERAGVNYQVTVRGEVQPETLRTLARALPADHSTPSAGEAVAPATDMIPAGTGDGFVAGAGAWTDDLDDEADLSRTSSYRHSNYVGVWQMILQVDAPHLPPTEVDCDFGPTTEQYTKYWQNWQNIGPSGALDASTRKRAQRFLALEYTVSDGSDYGYYLGLESNIFIHRHGPNISPAYRWDVQSVNHNDWHGAAYGYANFLGCRA
ncbi:hypothetical protein AB0F15_22730 [Amycolatopsis sp. NPDC026612]|uniref:hypothetical protein n=1 Tax=Amycolatopsis sp. NPDC026612 TaxID=3155466 RepID=UPI0033FD1389